MMRQRPMRHFILGIARVCCVPLASSVALIQIRPAGTLIAHDDAARNPIHFAPKLAPFQKPIAVRFASCGHAGLFGCSFA
jgi:hypothetical protein